MIPGALEAAGLLRSVELWTAAVSVRSPVRASHGTHGARSVVYLVVRTDTVEGWGEVVALERPVGTDPSLRQVTTELQDRWVPRLFEAARARRGSVPPSAVVSSLGGSRPADRTSMAAIEMALLDAELRQADSSLATWLEVTAGSVPYGAVLGIEPNESMSDLTARASELVESGAARLRLKISPGQAVAPASALVALGPRAGVQVDANGSYGLGSQIEPEAYRELMALDGLGLVCIEQPIAGADFAASASLAQSLSTPICLDESISSDRAARDALRYRACGVLCIKPGRLGGIRAALSVLDRVHEAGLDAFIGGMFETGLARSVVQVLAAMPGVSLVSDAAAAATYLIEDPCGAAAPEAGLQRLWSNPGLGPRPSEGACELIWRSGP